LNDQLARALRSLEGLATGDAFGELFFSISPTASSLADLPAGPWPWTDDTQMALSIVAILERRGSIDQDALAEDFAASFCRNPYRGYGGGAANLLLEIAAGGDWRVAAPALFGGGSYGNGAAMRAAPIGAFFAGDPARAAYEARLSAAVTHAHLEGQSGAIAVAVAAALVAGAVVEEVPPPSGDALLAQVLPFVADGLTKRRIEAARTIPAAEHRRAVLVLGTGYEVSAQDTVPFCLWSTAHHLGSYEEALWWTARGRGDCDTTCTIVGGIVALAATDIPAEWLRRREPLPAL